MNTDKWNSRHVIIALIVLVGMFIIKYNGIPEAELPYWYESVKWLTGIAIFGHALNKYVDNKKDE
jgi:hypothetical protein